MLHARARRSTSIRRAAGASAIGLAVGAGALFAPPASAQEGAEPGPVRISFYDYAATSGADTDLAFFQRPEGYQGGALRGRLVGADGALKAAAVDVSEESPGTVKVAAIAAGDVAELYDLESGTVRGRAVYDGKPELTAPVCSGTSSATGGRTAGEPIQNVEAFTPVPGAQSSADVKINPGTLAEQAAGGTTWSATFERPLALGDQVSVYSSATRGAVWVQSVVQRPVVDCPAPVVPAPVSAPATQPAAPAAPAADTTAPAGSSASVKSAKKTTLPSLTKDGLAYTVTAQETATLKATLTLRTTSGKGKKKKVKEQVVGTATQSVLAGAPLTLKLKADKAAASKLKKAAKQAGSKLVTTITLTDAAGNVTTLPSSTIALPKR